MQPILKHWKISLQLFIMSSLGAPTHYTEVAREEFLAMKCCSFERKDLERHFDRMSRQFYTIDEVDDVNIKQTFLNSLPESLGDETLRIMNI